LDFRKTAEKRNVSQPSLTRAIKPLEEELGSVRFDRQRANTHLSELGKMLAQPRRPRHRIEAAGSR
jgi:LysR family transcriptional regulator, hydrogen peroxide-inducible genes activator